MDILGIGFAELIFIFLIAMMVFGPRRLPEIANKAGKIVRDLRGMSRGLLTEWQREVTVAARMEELNEVRQELEETRKELTDTKQTIQKTSRNIASETSSLVENTIKPPPPAPKPAPSAIPPQEVMNE